jgi:hypothetical protein
MNDDSEIDRETLISCTLQVLGEEVCEEALRPEVGSAVAAASCSMFAGHIFDNSAEPLEVILDAVSALSSDDSDSGVGLLIMGVELAACVLD